MGQVCHVTLVLVVAMISLATLLVALLTDNWYRVTTASGITPELRRTYNFHYGLWRLCYDDMPTAVLTDDSVKKEGASCVIIHDSLNHKNEDQLSSEIRVRINLSRTVIGCNIAADAAILVAVITLLCGIWPGMGAKVKKPFLYFATSIILLLAVMSGITSGIAFIAVRDLDKDTVWTTSIWPPAVPDYASQEYHWSFMLHWIGTGLAFVDSFILLCMMRNTYQSANKNI